MGKKIHGKAGTSTVLLLLFLILIVIINFFVLKFRHYYHFDLGGTGDREYFSNDNFGPKFGVKDFSLWARVKWLRPMGRGFSINLPQSFFGKELAISFNILNLEKKPVSLAVSNDDNNVIGLLSVPPGRHYKKQQIDIKLANLQNGLLRIKVTNAKNPYKVSKLRIEKIEIYSRGGSSLTWKYNLQFVLASLCILAILLAAGFSINTSVAGSLGISVFLTVIRYIDVLVYIKYIKSFLPCVPFLFLTVIFIRILAKRNRLFSGETHKTLLFLFLTVFTIHFIGQFYLYHFHWDVELRISYYSVLESNGIKEYIKALSPSQLEVTGAKEGIMPYPPWFNLIALPFIKLGFDTDFWLRFQFILITSFFPIVVYALVSRLGFSKNEARWSSILSIFFMGFLDDLFFNAYDRMLAFLFTILFLIIWFKSLQDSHNLNFKKILVLGILLGLIFVQHPSVPIVMSIFIFTSFLFFIFSKRKNARQIAAKIALIYCIGLIVSLIVFYGPFIQEILTKTIPSALAARNAGVHHNSEFFFSFSKSILQTVYRIIRYNPLIIMPLLIYGFLNIKRKYKNADNKFILISLYIWIFTYALLVFLRSENILMNIFMWIPEQHFIHPLSSTALGIAVSRLLYKREKTSSTRTSRLKKAVLLSILVLWSCFNLFWFYAVRIGMIQSVGDLPKWLKIIA